MKGRHAYHTERKLALPLSPLCLPLCLPLYLPLCDADVDAQLLLHAPHNGLVVRFTGERCFRDRKI